MICTFDGITECWLQESNLTSIAIAVQVQGVEKGTLPERYNSCALFIRSTCAQSGIHVSECTRIDIITKLIPQMTLGRPKTCRKPARKRASALPWTLKPLQVQPCPCIPLLQSIACASMNFTDTSYLESQDWASHQSSCLAGTQLPESNFIKILLQE